jgi:hypothetical protein
MKAPAALIQGEETVSIKDEVGWAPEPIKKFWRTENISFPSWDSNYGPTSQ